ncbi:MAG: hypothetical protein WCL39_04050 [Armatimonadota bacterium]
MNLKRILTVSAYSRVNVILCNFVCVALCCGPGLAAGAVQRLEIVTGGAITGDGGNAWGGHQTRIVSNQNGLFTVYTVPGTGTYAHTSAFDKEWRLAKRTGDNQWTVIAQGPSGREPAILLSAPNGTLRVFAWPNMAAEMWSVGADGTVIAHITVPGFWESMDWPYHAAGTNPNGDMVVWQSGSLATYAYYSASTGQWTDRQSSFATMKRHCYNYVFPGANGEVTSVGTRDIAWSELGQPYDGYAFTAVGYFHTPSAFTQPTFSYTKLRESSTGSWFDWCCATASVYIDTIGRIHIIYWYSDDGVTRFGCGRHMVLQNGAIIADVAIPCNVTWPLADIIQNASGQFFLITPTAIYPAKSEDGTVLGDPVPIDLGYPVEYGGFTLACPQAGVPLQNDYVDLVFPSGGGAQDVYARLALETKCPTGSITISNGDNYTAATAVNLTIAASGVSNTVAQMKLSSDGVNWSPWEPYATSKPWTLTPGDGAKSVRICFADQAGYESPVATDSIGLDTTPPSATMTINSGAVGTNSLTLSVKITGSDNLSGIAQVRFQLDDGSWADWQAYASTLSHTIGPGDGARTVTAQVMDAVGNISASFSDSISVDATLPTIPGTPMDAGAFTNTKTIVFNWTAATDVSGPLVYICQIGTTPGGADTFSGSTASALTKSITGAYGQRYYCRVHARDAYLNHGDWSASSDGISVVSNPGMRILAAKRLADTTSVGLATKAVTAVFIDHFYVEEIDRSSGVKVVPADGLPTGIAVGKLVDVGGLLKTDANGERWLDATVKVLTGTTALNPLVMSNSSLGGGDFDYTVSPRKGQCGISGTVGINNIGLLVKTYGTVTQVGIGYFYVDDGNHLLDGTSTNSEMNVGVRVISSAAGYVPGDLLSVIGISSCYTPSVGQTVRRIVPRGGDDIVKMAP